MLEHRIEHLLTNALEFSGFTRVVIELDSKLVVYFMSQVKIVNYFESL